MTQKLIQWEEVDSTPVLMFDGLSKRQKKKELSSFVGSRLTRNIRYLCSSLRVRKKCLVARVVTTQPPVTEWAEETESLSRNGTRPKAGSPRKTMWGHCPRMGGRNDRLNWHEATRQQNWRRETCANDEISRSPIRGKPVANPMEPEPTGGAVP